MLGSPLIPAVASCGTCTPLHLEWTITNSLAKSEILLHTHFIWGFILFCNIFYQCSYSSQAHSRIVISLC